MPKNRKVFGDIDFDLELHFLYGLDGRIKSEAHSESTRFPVDLWLAEPWFEFTSDEIGDFAHSFLRDLD